jgi:hypothetical protein
VEKMIEVDLLPARSAGYIMTRNNLKIIYTRVILGKEIEFELDDSASIERNVLRTFPFGEENFDFEMRGAVKGKDRFLRETVAREVLETEFRAEKAELISDFVETQKLVFSGEYALNLALGEADVLKDVVPFAKGLVPCILNTRNVATLIDIREQLRKRGATMSFWAFMSVGRVCLIYSNFGFPMCALVQHWSAENDGDPTQLKIVKSSTRSSDLVLMEEVAKRLTRPSEQPDLPTAWKLFEVLSRNKELVPRKLDSSAPGEVRPGKNTRYYEDIISLMPSSVVLTGVSVAAQWATGSHRIMYNDREYPHVICKQSELRSIIDVIANYCQKKLGEEIVEVRNRALSVWPDIRYERIRINTEKSRMHFDFYPILESEIVAVCSLNLHRLKTKLVTNPIATLRFLASEEILRVFFARINKFAYVEGSSIKILRALLGKIVRGELTEETAFNGKKISFVGTIED